VTLISRRLHFAGEWAPYANQIAVWQGGAWWFYPPVTGMRVYFVNHIGFYFWNGATWSPESNLVGPRRAVLSVAGHPPDSAGNVALVYGDISWCGSAILAELLGHSARADRSLA
jgi:hypothetical protein